MSEFQEAIERDLAKCKAKLGHRSIWVIAAESNKREKVVNVKRVKSLPTFMGC